MSDSSRPHGLQPTRLLCPWDFPGKSTGVGCHYLLCLGRLWPDNKVTFCYSGYTLKGIYFQKGKFSKNFKKEMKWQRVLEMHDILKIICVNMCAKSPQLCSTLWNPMDCSPSGSSVHGILQARILEWVVRPSSRESSWPRDGTSISCVICIAGGCFTTEQLGKPYVKIVKRINNLNASNDTKTYLNWIVNRMLGKKS